MRPLEPDDLAAPMLAETIEPIWGAAAEVSGPIGGEMFEPWWQPSGKTTARAEPRTMAGSVDADAVEQAYRRGYGDAMLHGEERLTATVRELNMEFELRLAEAEASRLEEQASGLAERLEASISEMEDRIQSQTVEAIVALAKNRMGDEAVEELAVAAGRLMDLRSGLTIFVSGNGPLLNNLGDALLGRGFSVELIQREGSGVEILIDGTVIRSRLPDWINRLERLVQ